jgi:hypothetical protein
LKIFRKDPKTVFEFLKIAQKELTGVQSLLVFLLFNKNTTKLVVS